MKINTIPGISYDSNIYVIMGKIPTIIDTGTGLNPVYVEEKIKNIIDPVTIKQIILTHEHYDHCGGVKQLFELTGKNAKIMSHDYASEKIQKGESEFAMMLGGSMPKMNVDKKLQSDQELIIGDETFKIIHTPGHTPGCICLYSKESSTLFSGDTIFAHGSFGRYDFAGGNLEDLKKSIENISKLEIKNLYPGHENIVEGDAKSHILKSLQNIKYIS